MTVSKKFYVDIISRIESALSFAPGSAAEAVRLVDTYLLGGEAASADPCAMLAFNMIKPCFARVEPASGHSCERKLRRCKLSANVRLLMVCPESGFRGRSVAPLPGGRRKSVGAAKKTVRY